MRPRLTNTVDTQPELPSPRGDLSAALLEALPQPPHEVPVPVPLRPSVPLADDDLQLSLYVLYELHYRQYAGVSAVWEWNSSLLRMRAALESMYLEALRERVPPTSGTPAESVGETLFALAESDEGPAVSRFLETRGTAEQLSELMVHKSAYQLKEADPHSWAIPRLSGKPKSALLEIQYDEYGAGRAERMHSRLFANAMRAIGLDGSYGVYLDAIPGSTLATVNLITLFGLHRSYLGALVGHLAMFEIASAIPNRRYGNAIRRLGLATPAAVDFFDEHVEADSVHENIAAYDLAQEFAIARPEAADDVVFGARSLLAVEAEFANRLLERWNAGESSLLAAAPVGAVA